jgi:hypothetical protein
MKHLQIGFIVLSFALCSSFSKAQDNIHLFAEEGTEWSVGNFYPSNEFPAEMFYIRMLGDSVIGENTYYKIWSSEFQFSESQLGELSCLVRVTNDSLLFIRALDEIEYLVFNYKLDVNQNEFIYWFSLDYSELVDARVVSKYEEEILGESRIVWELENNAKNPAWAQWIEGVGPNSGILWANFMLNPLTGFWPILLCASVDEMQIYQNSNYDFCEYFIPETNDRISLLAEQNTVWTNAKYSSPYQLTRKDYLWLFGTTQYDVYDSDYHHIVRHSDEYPPTLENSEIAFYVKVFEDSVLYIKNLDNVEHPIFDFKMNPGDNASMHGFDYLTGDFYPLEITIEDTGRVETLSGERRYWDVISTGYTRWIEGLGNEEGLMYANYALQGFVGETNFMICAFNEGNQLYINSLFSDCLISKISDSENDKLFSIEQNNDLIRIFSISPLFSCDVFDLAGRKVYSDRSNHGLVEFSTDIFNNGLYLIYLNEGATRVLFKTVIINDF